MPVNGRLPANEAPHGLEFPTEGCPPFNYDLYGTVNHYGTLSGGHYTAFVRDSYRNSWNAFDDSKATRLPVEEVVVSPRAPCACARTAR